MIEIRKLMRPELERLLKEAPESETKFIKDLEKNTGEEAFDFFERKSIVMQGLVIDGRPIYIAAVMQSKDDRYVFWTIVNSNVDNKLSLSKYSKKELNKWLQMFGTIYATMGKENIINMKWVEWMGFERISEDDDSITYKLGA